MRKFTNKELGDIEKSKIQLKRKGEGDAITVEVDNTKILIMYKSFLPNSSAEFSKRGR